MAIQCNALCAGTSSCQISDILQSQHQSPVAILRIKLQTASGVVSLGKVRRNLSRSKSEARCQSLLVPLSEIRLLTNCFEIKRLLLASISCSVACVLFDFTQCAEGCGATVQDLLEITRSRLLPLAWARMSRQTRQLLLCLTVLVQQQVWQLPTQLQQTLCGLLSSTLLTILSCCRHGYALAVGYFTRLLFCSFSRALYS